MIDLEKAQPYLRAHRGQLFVLKVGGECLATPARLRRLAQEIALVEALGPRLVVVHGAGPQTDALLAGFGESTRKVGGRRVTTPSALRWAEMMWTSAPSKWRESLTSSAIRRESMSRSRPERLQRRNQPSIAFRCCGLEIVFRPHCDVCGASRDRWRRCSATAASARISAHGSRVSTRISSTLTSITTKTTSIMRCRGTTST